MAKRPKDTIVTRYQTAIRKNGKRPAFLVEDSSGRTSVSWQNLYQQATLCARALLALEVEFGARLAFIGYDSAEWVYFEQGALLAGAWVRGLPSGNDVGNSRYQLGDMQSPIVLLQEWEEWRRVAEDGELSHVRHLIVLDPVEDVADPRAMSWETFLDAGKPVGDAALRQRQERLVDIDVAMRRSQWEPGCLGVPNGKVSKTLSLQRLC